VLHRILQQVPPIGQHVWVGVLTSSIDGLPPGAYSIDVDGTEPGTSLASVSSDILIWEDPNHS
jgi:hypothetical protein